MQVFFMEALIFYKIRYFNMLNMIEGVRKGMGQVLSLLAAPAFWMRLRSGGDTGESPV
jgi:hypothetical protein